MATMPVVPPAPALFSITNCWPSRRDIRSANMRANTSVLPPAANGTTTVTGFDGQTACAQARCAQTLGAQILGANAVTQLDATAPKSSATAMRFILRLLRWLLFQCTDVHLHHTCFPDICSSAFPGLSAAGACDGMTPHCLVPSCQRDWPETDSMPRPDQGLDRLPPGSWTVE